MSAAGGLWILDAAGRHLGTLRGSEHPHNMAWGGVEGRTLYLAAQTGIYCIRLGVPGAGAWWIPSTVAGN
jgi:gluconolactonase